MDDVGHRSDSQVRGVVIGGSAGGIEALTRLAAGLTSSFPAPVLVVIHFPQHGQSHLKEILNRAGPLPAVRVTDGMALEPGRIHVGPAGFHLRVRDGIATLDRGPRENRCRPAIDPLFRSAADAWGEGSVAVLLSGNLDDGSAGAASVERAGGIVIVQDPEDAACKSMPMKALEIVRAALVVPSAAIGPVLNRLVEDGDRHSIERMQSKRPHPAAQAAEATLGSAHVPDLTPLTCPDCGGPLHDGSENDAARFRCTVGHVYSPKTLYDAQPEQVEAALWESVRALVEQSRVARRLAERTRDRNPQAAARFDRRERDAVRSADRIREVLEQLGQNGVDAMDG
jgi:two-component system, chemotaxis family, protein-glutamate methylesterase/glutaminase